MSIAPNIGEIEIVSSIELNFQPKEIEVKAGFGTCTVRVYDMTRDGFTLLAMGFTGAKALQFKLAYIAAFNEMEAKLKSSTPALPNFADPAAAAIAWGVQIFLEPPTSSNKTDRRITHMTCAPNFGGTSIR